MKTWYAAAKARWRRSLPGVESLDNRATNLGTRPLGKKQLIPDEVLEQIHGNVNSESAWFEIFRENHGDWGNVNVEEETQILKGTRKRKRMGWYTLGCLLWSPLKRADADGRADADERADADVPFCHYRQRLARFSKLILY